MQLSEKQSEKSVRESVEWKVPFNALKPEPSGKLEVFGVGRVSSSMSSLPPGMRGSASDERSWRSWYRLRSRYRREA